MSMYLFEYEEIEIQKEDFFSPEVLAWSVITFLMLLVLAILGMDTLMVAASICAPFMFAVTFLIKIDYARYNHSQIAFCLFFDMLLMLWLAEVGLADFGRQFRFLQQFWFLLMLIPLCAAIILKWQENKRWMQARLDRIAKTPPSSGGEEGFVRRHWAADPATPGGSKAPSARGAGSALEDEDGEARKPNFLALFVAGLTLNDARKILKSLAKLVTCAYALCQLLIFASPWCKGSQDNSFCTSVVKTSEAFGQYRLTKTVLPTEYMQQFEDVMNDASRQVK